MSYLGRCCRRSVGNWVAARGGPVCPQNPEIAHRRYRVRGMTVKKKGASVTKEEAPLIHRHNHIQESSNLERNSAHKEVLYINFDNSNMRTPQMC